MPLTISMSAAQLLKKPTVGVHSREIDNFIAPIQAEALQKNNGIRNSYKMIQFELDDKNYHPGIIFHQLLLIVVPDKIIAIAFEPGSFANECKNVSIAVLGAFSKFFSLKQSR